MVERAANRAERLAFRATQMARLYWYAGQGMLAQRWSRAAAPAALERPPEAHAGPGAQALTAELTRLIERDWQNIEAGHYRAPHDLVRNPAAVLGEAVAFFRDLPQVARRRRERNGNDLPPDLAEGLPRYYRRNFHFQTDGYLSEQSARLYDQQVEVLFGGGAAAMRRQALVPIARHLRGRARTPGSLLDVGAGTGQFLTWVKQNHPRLAVTALDLSAAYLAEAGRRLAPWSRVRLVEGAAEAIPAPDASFDLVTSIYLLHELPRPVRCQAAAEMARVLKPGGRLVLVDSLQQDDRPDFAPLLNRFPDAFHEPYYRDYLGHDLAALFAGLGLVAAPAEPVFLSKLMVFDKPSL
jgi:ubiquinone/menaquinone biosynthesis C-methylase UbiE